MHVLAAEALDPRAARKLAQALAGRIAGAVLYPGGALRPPQVCRRIADAAREVGAEVADGTDVLRLLTRGRRVTGVETRRGMVPAGEIVVAAGAWSDRLVRPLRLRLRIAPAKGYHHLDLARPPAPDASLPLFLQEARIVVTPLAGRLRLAGTL